METFPMNIVIDQPRNQLYCMQLKTLTFNDDMVGGKFFIRPCPNLQKLGQIMWASLCSTTKFYTHWLVLGDVGLLSIGTCITQLHRLDCSWKLLILGFKVSNVYTVTHPHRNLTSEMHRTSTLLRNVGSSWWWFSISLVSKKHRTAELQKCVKRHGKI